MGNLLDELIDDKIKREFDRYLRIKLAELNDLMVENKTREALVLLQSTYKDGFEDGYSDAMHELRYVE